jgi:septal ring factor EnvC (AmiA/AmiB activator)
MYTPDTDTSKLEVGYNLEKSLKEARETVYEGRKAVEDLTSSITQLVYEEDRRRKEFTEILAAIQAVLDTVQNKSIAAYQRYNGDAILTSNLKALNKEILKATGLVSSSDIEEMKEIIEDLANWELNEQ